MNSPDQFETFLANKGKDLKKKNELIELDNKQREQTARKSRISSIEKSLITLFNTGQFSAESMMAAIEPHPNAGSNGATQPQSQAFKATVEKPQTQAPLNNEKPRAYSSGWIKFHRKTQQSEMYRDLSSVQRDVYIQCLLMANHNEAEWEWKGQIHKCKPGQFKTSLEGIRQNCAKGTTIKMIRTALKKLEKWQFLASSGSKQGRIITIINLGTHQVKFQPGGKETGNGNYTDRNMLKQEEVMGVAG